MVSSQGQQQQLLVDKGPLGEEGGYFFTKEYRPHIG